MKRASVLHVARLIGLAPFCRETAYFYSVPWRIYSVILIVVYNIIMMIFAIWMVFSELVEDFSATRVSNPIILTMYCCFIMTCLLAFSWGCVTRQHTCLHLLLTKLADSSGSCPRWEAILLFLAVPTFLATQFLNEQDNSQQSNPLMLFASGSQLFTEMFMPVTISMVSLLLRSIAKQYKQLNMRAEKVFAKRSLPGSSDITMDILLLRESHQETNDTLKSLCFCVGFQLTVFLGFFIFLYVSSLSLIWRMLFHIPPRLSYPILLSVNYLVYVTAMILTLIFASEMAMSEGNELRRILRNALKSGNFNEEEREQIDRFASFLYFNRVEVSLPGVWAIKYKLLLTIFSTVATYVAILGQIHN